MSIITVKKSEKSKDIYLCVDHFDDDAFLNRGSHKLKDDAEPLASCQNISSGHPCRQNINLNGSQLTPRKKRWRTALTKLRKSTKFVRQNIRRAKTRINKQKTKAVTLEQVER